LFPASQAANQEIAEFVVSTFPAPAVALSVLGKILRRCRAENAMPFLDFTQKFGVVLHDKDVDVMADANVAPILCTLAGFCLLKPNDLRLKAFRSVIALFRVADAIPGEGRSEIMGESISFQRCVELLLKFLVKTLENSRFDACAIHLLTFVAGLKEIDVPQAVICRALFASKADLILETAAPQLREVLSGGKLNDYSIIHVRAGFMQLVRRSLAKLLGIVLVSAPSPVSLRLLSDVLERKDLLDLFFSEFQKFLLTNQQALQFLPIIIPADPSGVHFPEILCDIIVWIGVAFQNKQKPDPIQDSIKMMYDRIPIASRASIWLNLSDYSGLDSGLKSIASQLIKINPKRVSDIVQHFGPLAQTGQPAILLSGGVFFIHVMAKFSSYKDAESVAFMRSLVGLIIGSFSVDNHDYCRFLAVAFQTAGIIQLFTADQLAPLFRIIILNLRSTKKAEFGRLDTTRLLLKLCEVLPPRAQAQEVELFLSLLRATFTPTDLSLNLLKYFVGIRSNVLDFIDLRSVPSFLSILSLLSNPNTEFRNLANEIFEKLESGSTDKSLVKDIANQIGLPALAQSMTRVLQDVAVGSMDDSWFKILADLCDVYGHLDDAAGTEVLGKVILLLIKIVQQAKPEPSQRAAEILKQVYA
jgi:hypothetical protein